MKKSYKLFIILIIIPGSFVDCKPIYSKNYDNQQLEVRQIDGLGQIVPGLVGTAVGGAVNPGIGGIVGGIVGPIIGNIVTSAVDNLLANLGDDQMFTTARDAPAPYDSYVVNIPNVGPYVLLVPKPREIASENLDGSAENKDKSASGSEDKTRISSLISSGRSPSSVRVIPYKSLHLMKKPPGSSQVKLFHQAQN